MKKKNKTEEGKSVLLSQGLKPVFSSLPPVTVELTCGASAAGWERAAAKKSLRTGTAAFPTCHAADLQLEHTRLSSGDTVM